MKVKKIIKTEEEEELFLPAFRKDGNNIFKIVSENVCVTVWLLDFDGEKLFSISTSRNPNDIVHMEEATEEEFNTALHEGLRRATALSQTHHWKSENVEELANAFFPHEIKDENL